MRTRRTMMEPKIVAREAFTVVGMKYHGKNENNEIPQLWDKFGPRAEEIKHIVDPHVAYGVCGNFDDSSHEFDYVAGFEVDSTTEIPEGMVSWDVPAGKYAVFTCTLPTLGETYQHAYHTWLPQSGYQRAPGPEFELYDESFDPEDPSSKMDAYIPLK
jgi:AraC family transcriptional regulator